MEHFNKLNNINVNEHTEKKDGLTYLSWAWAWAEVKKAYPDAQYTIKRFDGKPYLFDEDLGYMVFTEMTIENHTHEMWLPVMNGANKAMNNHTYQYEVKKYEWDDVQRRKVWKGNYDLKDVEPATMFDINTAIMRCLTKNIAMFGLGLYIYAGEDLPEGETASPDIEETEPTKTDLDRPKPTKTQETVDTIVNFGRHKGKTVQEIFNEDPDYVKWLADKAEKEDVREAAKRLTSGARDITAEVMGFGDNPKKTTDDYSYYDMRKIEDDLPF